MKNTFTKFLIAAAIVVAPAAASALTVSGDVTGNSTCASKFQFAAYQVDVLAGASVNAAFDGTEAAGTTCFDLVNTSSSLAAVTVAVATVNQHGLSTDTNAWGWLGGIEIDTSNGGATTHTDVAEGVAWNGTFSFVIAANSFALFDWTYGAAYSTGSAKPEFDFVVSATVVPVPAAGFLLLGALGGLGFAGRRRRKKA